MRTSRERLGARRDRPRGPGRAHRRHVPVLALVVALGVVLAAVLGPGSPGTDDTSSPERPTLRPAAAPMAAAPPVRVAARAVGLDAPLVGLGLDASGGLALPPDAATAGWYTGGPPPGVRGPAVLAGHVDWDHRRGAFADIDRLRPGDLVEVIRADDTVARFEVQTVRRVGKQRFPTRQVYGDLPGAGLRLVTCGGDFDRAAHSYTDNVVVWAALVTPEP